MTRDYTPQLPDILPTGDILVETEGHRYMTYEGDGGDILEEREYTLDKAPIDEIVNVVGVSDNDSYTFEQGTDYELSSDDERIIWLDDPASRPDSGSMFYVDYRCESLVSRYLESGEEEMSTVEDQLQQVIESKFIDQAKGEDLDKIGELFGKLGDRRERTDTQYRLYLKSIVQSFVSRGTKSGIKAAIETVTNVPAEDITIEEDFDNNAYAIIVVADTAVQPKIIQEIAEIADPSGVELLPARFTIEENPVGVNDKLFVNRNRFDPGIDVIGISEDVTVNPNTHQFTDGFGSDDAVTITEGNVATWDDSDWDDMGWAVEHN